MKLQKVALILSLSVCMVGTQVVPALAQENELAVQSSIYMTEEERIEAEKEAEERAKEEEEARKRAEEEAAEEAARAQAELQALMQAQKDELDQSLTEAGEVEGPKTEPTGTDEENTDPKEGEDSKPDDGGGASEKGDDKDGEDKEGEDPTGTETGDSEDVTPETPEDQKKTEDQKKPNKPNKEKEKAKELLNPSRSTGNNRKEDLGDFEASSKFIDNRDKIKYNVDVPIKGLPSFITSEMIVGALKCQDQTGYPASVTIAQIVQESGYGKYGPGGKEGKGLSYLAYQYNNLFGIKGKGPAGSVNMRTGEQTADGETYMTHAGFRVYNTYTECIDDRSKLLDEVYRDLTFGVDDANTFAMKIGSRWATDIDYGQTLIQVMKKYDLYRLDEMTVGEYSNMLGIFVNPCPGSTLSSGFGKRTAPIAGATTYHKGIDMGTGGQNIPTYAAAEGEVTFAGHTSWGGYMVAVDHGNGLVTKYLHHDKIYVKKGDKVQKGQQIGLSGSTGISTGNHLHFQVERNGVPVNPLDYLKLK